MRNFLLFLRQGSSKLALVLLKMQRNGFGYVETLVHLKEHFPLIQYTGVSHQNKIKEGPFFILTI